MATQTVIFIDKEGNLSGLADTTLDRLTDLGKKRVQRVSDIEFDEDKQVWVARDLDGFVIGEHPIRAELIAIEREYLNDRIVQEFEKQ